MLSIIKLIPGNISAGANRAYKFKKIIPASINCESVKYFSKKTAIRKSLGIPEPPKRPMNAFMRFVQITRASKLTTQRELIKKAANRWKNLHEDEKRIFYQEYEQDLNQYSKDIETYNKSMDPNKLMAIKQGMQQQLENRLLKIEKRNYDNMLHEMGKPKKPLTSYFLFRMDCLKAGIKDPNVKDIWATLDTTRRKQYSDESAKRQEIFNKQLIQWESQMVALNRGHLVRKNLLEKWKIKELEIEGIIKKK